MDWNTHFKPFALASNEALPELAISHLSQWGLISMLGEDKKSYLQGQVTCDVVSLNQEQSTLGAHCDAKGKTWSAFRLFHHGDGYAMFQPQSAIAQELVELKKYAIFSKVTIEQSQDILLGVIGHQAQSFVDSLSEQRGDVRKVSGGTAVKISQQRWLLALDSSAALQLVEGLSEQYSGAPLCDNSLWTLLDILEANPVIEDFAQNQHIPQAVNLQAIGGISFSKGCYTGQETVARAKYRGMNKREMIIVESEKAETLKPNEHVNIERSVGDNWRAVGSLLTYFQYSDGKVIGQLIAPNNLEDDTTLRLASTEGSIWKMNPLPYSLDDEE
ncbi:tRNA-modifying protein YgfZ [Vibrio agarivorans]|uniref:tRNA-modifying protein YgfZ n=1 Tax=Vibrio agarivorans TaxID=153622 RepID=A0ABT7Y207_9VIBR|nr:tRNA-modifying protein YgfZ [Vibrio agarivorans]MDN2482058.1 tRNA-modifying protein YgfZ [Vibrio agarivorans]